ncbi:hypothetical protein J6590_006411 [Homalodisca vitripennis]|nr:hypothetical protein J6590_006411 [Homalodisca vitripennis]
MLSSAPVQQPFNAADSKKVGADEAQNEPLHRFDMRDTYTPGVKSDTASDTRRWDKRKDSGVGTPVTLRVDERGFYLYWTDQNKLAKWRLDQYSPLWLNYDCDIAFLFEVQPSTVRVQNGVSPYKSAFRWIYIEKGSLYVLLGTIAF